MKLSVIVPAHNSEKYIVRCVSSITKAIDSSLIDAEIIVINDGSRDGTDLRCQELSDRIAYLSYISMEDRGVSAARNAGIDAAIGEYITFVDADDVVRPDMFSKLLSAMEDNKKESDIAFAGCDFFSWTDAEINNATANISSKLDIEYEAYDGKTYIDEQIIKGNSRCWSKLFSRKVLDENNLRFEEGLSIGEDMLFVASVANAVGSDKNAIIELTNYKGYGYYQNVNGAINRPFTPSYMDQITCWKRLFNYSDNGQVTINLIIGIMLTVSKIAKLKISEFKRYQRYIDECHDNLMSIQKECFRKLDRGYRIKTNIFIKYPKLYLFLYHIWK